MAKTNKQFKIDATRPFYAYVGAVDLAVEFARGAATDVQARINKVELEPKALRHQARTVVASGVDEVSDAYGDLTARGKNLVTRVRRQQATQDAKAAAETTKAKAKTAKTQTSNSADTTTETAKKSASNAAKSTKTAAKQTKTAAKQTGDTAKRNAKATSTSAKKTASATTRATADAASKVGD